MHILENTPTLLTDRLILRRFTSEDLPAFFEIMRDKEANTFLPWFCPQTMAQAETMLYERYLSWYERPSAYRYAICLKEDDCPIGYMGLGEADSYDFGYGLRTPFWHKGIAREAAQAVVSRIKAAGYPYITATHDRKNPRSGAVMQAIGMKYCYSYEEQWQPKDFPVIFRMYQLNFDGNDARVYQKYWEQSDVHFVENIET